MQGSTNCVTVTAGGFPAEVSWTLSCNDGTYVSGGAPYSATINVVDLSSCTLTLMDSWGDGWNGASFYAPNINGATITAGSYATLDWLWTMSPAPAPPPSSGSGGLPPPPPPSPSPPPVSSGSSSSNTSPTIQFHVEVSFTAAGDITDYADGTAAATSIKVGLATAAGVTADDVTLHEITSGSVNIEARILVADNAAAGTTKSALTAVLTDTTVSSTLLGVAVESTPQLQIGSETLAVGVLAVGVPNPPAEGLGGGTIFFLLVGLATIVCLATVAYKQREIIKEQGLRRVVKDDLAHVKENLKNGSYKEAIKKQASASKEAMKKLKPAAKKEGTPAPTDLTSTSAGKADRQAVAV